MATKTALQNGSATVSGAHTAELHHQKTAAAPKRRKTTSKKVEDEGLGATLCTLICNHQIGTLAHSIDFQPVPLLTPNAGISVNLLSLLFLTHIFFPRARDRTTKFFTMSYYNPETNMYGCGTDDLPYVVFWTVAFTGLRVAVMDYMLDPLARLGGIRTKKGLDRFKEQAWLIVYYIISWSLGMVRESHGYYKQEKG